MGHDKSDILESLNFSHFYEAVFGELPRAKNGWAYPLPCPFHNEKHPSLSVNIEHGGFNCFGCAEKGDVFKFVMLMQGCDFSGAVAYLANFSGYIHLPDSQKKPKKKDGFRWARLFDRWQVYESGILAGKIKQYEKMLDSAKNMANIEQANIETWKYQWGILSLGSDSDRYALMKEKIDGV